MSTAVKRRIAVAMSGGVDSSVAAYLMVQKFKDCPDTSIFGLYMQNWAPQDELLEDNRMPRAFCEASERDRQDAERVCKHLGISFHTANFVKEYWTQVFEPFIDDLSVHNVTPNPDVMCNREIKFGAMRDYILREDMPQKEQSIVTGHYARLAHCMSDVENTVLDHVDARSDDQKWLSYSDIIKFHGISKEGIKSPHSPMLLAARDTRKDQSYFLSGTHGQSLRNVMFPLGDLIKNKSDCTDKADRSVREIAVLGKLPTAEKHESMGICFIGKRKFPDFVRSYLPTSDTKIRRDFIDIDTGRVMGSHDSGLLLTIGQGAKIGGASKKWFVCKKDSETGSVYVCGGTRHPALYVDTFTIPAEKFNWIGGNFEKAIETSHLRAFCRIRHQQPLVECTIRKVKNEILVSSSSPLRGVTSGQMASIYIVNGIVCLGGGPIQRSGPTYFDRSKELPKTLHPAGLNDLTTI